MDTQQLMLDLAESADIPVRTPPYLPLLSRSLSILEGVALAVNPRYSMLRAVAPLASHWLQDKGLCEEEDVWGESTGRPGAADAAVDLLTSDSVATSVEMATLARWVLTADSISAQAALERVLQQPELSSDTCCVPCGRGASP
jgi:predicted unusual protein kinase regulating ubiquinone biosynthesis (AarF/ABC1/UbiB family)